MTRLIAAQIPDLTSDADRFHPDFLARAQLQLMNVFLHIWATDHLGAVLKQLPQS